MSDDIKAAREKRKRQRHGKLVLAIWDKVDRADARAVRDRRAEVERKSRERDGLPG